jgi:hypothetical protein
VKTYIEARNTEAKEGELVVLSDADATGLDASKEAAVTAEIKAFIELTGKASIKAYRHT